MLLFTLIRRRAALLGLLLFPLLAPAQTRELSSSGELLDGVAALVNDGIVLRSELTAEVRTIVARLEAQGTALPPAQTLNRQVLERLVTQRLQLQRAERLGIQISDETLNQALNSVAERNQVSLADFPALLAREGVSYSAYRSDLRNQIAMEQLRQRDVLARIAVSSKEVDEYLARQAGKTTLRQEYLLSHILVAVSDGATNEQLAAAEQRINEVNTRLKAGEDFAKLAVAYSDGQQALEGGSLGWRKGAELPSLFADIVPGLVKGQVSEPIRSSSGFHLIRLNDQRGGEPIMENQVKARHILINTTEVVDDATAKQRLTELRERVLKGEDFGAMAKAVSDDTESAVDGGDLGWTGPGAFVGEFEERLKALTINEISQPFRTQFGWHIVQLLERRVYDATADRQRQQATLAIRNSRLGEETELWARRLRDEAYVEYRM
jgi:peptidyl-prolyl cis-trans isomerase SurA